MAQALDTTASLSGFELLNIQVDEQHTLRAEFCLPPDQLAGGPICIICDGTRLATMTPQPVPNQTRHYGLSCSLPHAVANAAIEVELRRHNDGALIHRQRLQAGAPLTNAHGLPARKVIANTMFPLYSAPWISFDGAILSITGAHLPPEGDPARLSLELEPGVVGGLEYPLASPEFGAHYWYWPNAHFSGFRVNIDLPACAIGANPWTFRFNCHLANPPADPAPGPWQDRGRVWIPRDLSAFVGFPTQSGQLTRVQTWSEGRTVTFTGYNAFRAFESLLARYGIADRTGLAVLDWGCGHGRVTRHFIEHWRNSRIIGTDIDAENIAWCADNLAGGSFLVAPLWPPLAIKSGSLDVIIGLSVMTHLTAQAQDAWITEICRLLRPGGIALLSFGGDAAAAYASIHHTPEWWESWQRTGFDDSLADPALQGKITDAAYYRVTHQSCSHVRESWSRALTLLEIIPQAFGYQDVAVLQR